MDQYKIQKTVGDGTFGTVYKAIHIKSGEVVAIKKMKQKFQSWDECMTLKELKSLRKLKHPNITKLKEVFKIDNELYFVFEFLDQNIYQKYMYHRETGKPLPENEIRSIIYQIASGLAYMHKHGYFHRDLKPENLLVSQDIVKIGDFGLAREVRSRPPYTEYVATRWYRAPEILLRSPNYNSPIDIFALGCIMAELYLLAPLFNGNSEMDQIYKICSILGTPTAANWSEGHKLATQMNFNFPQYSPVPLELIIRNASSDAIHLISEMLRYDPHKRPSAQQIMQHPYFSGYVPIERGLTLSNIEEKAAKEKCESPKAKKEVKMNSSFQDFSVDKENSYKGNVIEPVKVLKEIVNVNNTVNTSNPGPWKIDKIDLRGSNNNDKENENMFNKPVLHKKVDIDKKPKVSVSNSTAKKLLASLGLTHFGLIKSDLNSNQTEATPEANSKAIFPSLQGNTFSDQMAHKTLMKKYTRLPKLDDSLNTSLGKAVKQLGPSAYDFLPSLQEEGVTQPAPVKKLQPIAVGSTSILGARQVLANIPIVSKSENNVVGNREQGFYMSGLNGMINQRSKLDKTENPLLDLNQALKKPFADETGYGALYLKETDVLSRYKL